MNYPYETTLARAWYRGMEMMITVEEYRLTLSTLGGRADNPMAPRGLQRFTESHYPAPTFLIFGDFARDSENAAAWLDMNRVAIHAADVGREYGDILY